MAKKKAKKKAPKKASKKASKKPKKLSLEERVSELEGDLLRFAEMLGKILGEPYASEAKKIALKKQG